ncbi:methyl-accepting chemotaxis protein [Desulfonema ishimotonii]|uniref:Methyl-accepting chemotaxis protein n=1 Tax=Desulfonema ishimotonii TaxID=45657 RepID=A0A401G193_9BACT|nr:methyl-accepting chemotaxis protein [Desulfonema ishimotonii]GBC63008.1 methyl-accepting chemotaxis protein [Desulfonema ishimotonii]
MRQDVHLGVKIGLGFLAMLLLTLGVGYVGYYSLESVSERVDKADDINRMVKMILEARRHEKNFIIRGDHSYVEKVSGYIRTIRRQAGETRKKFTTPHNREQIDAIRASVDVYEKAFLGYVDFLEKKSPDKELRAKADEIMVTAAREVLSVCYDTRSDQKNKMHGQMRWAKRVLAGGAILALFLGAFLALAITRAIIRPVVGVVHGLTDAAGQLAATAAQVSSASQSLARGPLTRPHP